MEKKIKSVSYKGKPLKREGTLMFSYNEINYLSENFILENPLLFAVEYDKGEKFNMTQTETTNALTKSIIDFITLHRGFARRINTSGIPIIVNGKVKGYRKSKNIGAADIRAIYDGLSIDIEIKSKSDKLNPDQENFKREVLKAGGFYFEVRNFEEFYNYWNLKILN